MPEYTNETSSGSAIADKVFEYIDTEGGKRVPLPDLVDEFEEAATERDIRKAVAGLSKRGLIRKVGKDTYAGETRHRAPKRLGGQMPSVDRKFARQIFENAGDWLASFVYRGNVVEERRVGEILRELGWSVTDEETVSIVSRLRLKRVIRARNSGILQPQHDQSFSLEIEKAKVWLTALFEASGAALDVEDVLINFLEAEDEGVPFSMRAVQESLISLLQGRRVLSTSKGLRLLTEEQTRQRKAAREALSKAQPRTAESNDHAFLTDTVVGTLKAAGRNMTIEEVFKAVKETGRETTYSAVSSILCHLVREVRVVRKSRGKYAHPDALEETTLSDLPLNDIVLKVLRDNNRIMTADDITLMVKRLGVVTNKCAINCAVHRLVNEELVVRKSRGKFAYPDVQEETTLNDLPLTEVVLKVLLDGGRIMTTADITLAVRGLGITAARSAVSGAISRLTSKELISKKAVDRYAHIGFGGTLSIADMRLSHVVETVVLEAGSAGISTDDAWKTVLLLGRKTGRGAVKQTLYHLVGSEKLVRIRRGVYAHPCSLK